MATSYHVYANDGQGGVVNDVVPIATTTAPTYVVGALAAPSDNTFAVRAFDPATGIEEANADARVRVVIDGSGRDITSRPNPVVGLSVRPTSGGSCWVSWGYSPNGQGGPPLNFQVGLTSGSTSATTATVAYLPGVAGYGCSLSGLTADTSYTIAVQSVGASPALVANAPTVALTYRSSALSPVDSLVAVASA